MQIEYQMISDTLAELSVLKFCQKLYRLWNNSSSKFFTQKMPEYMVPRRENLFFFKLRSANLDLPFIIVRHAEIFAVPA